MNKIKPSTYDAIIEAGFQLYSEDPTASIADISERAGIGRATFHRHFSGRDDLLIALAKTAITELDATVDKATANAQSYTEALQLSMEAIVPLANRQWFLAQEAIESHPEIALEYQRQADELAEVIDEAKQEGSISESLTTVWITQAFDYLLFAAWEMVRKREATPKQAADMAWQTFYAGVSK